ncbi:MAG TPA: hypothetical protein VGZ00_10715 [Candidatus Baltobacteraceae bacterium]|jgi:hypothetical protein|nr:hypothetical protein [Candidatus Baltobacteraceae bacterium]
MSDESDDLNPNPIVAMAMRIRARRELAAAVEASARVAPPPGGSDAAASLTAFADALKIGTQRLESILGRNAVTFVRLERPLRVRLRFRDKRVSLDLDAGQQLVIVRGLGFDGEYQFIPDAPVPALINLSKLSTDEGYGDALTPSILLKTITQDAELPRPAHLDSP